MLKVALTGNIASGKSTVAERWKAAGATLIDADELARAAVARGTPALARIAESWGPGILLPSGDLDRAALRDVVFRDPVERKRLEQIVHPEVNRLRQEELAKAGRAGAEIVVADIPLLFEAGLEDEFDLVVLVESPEDVRKQRLLEQRGLQPEEASRMIASQWPSERKRARADFVIENRGSIADLEERAREVWSLIARNASPDSTRR